jgi:acetolactate synthase-1/2/3 large subunit
MTTTRGARLVVQALVDEGVAFTFGIPGTHTIELYDVFEDTPSIKPVLVTSEHAASFMADGLARTSDQIGVLTVVPGAGVTHAMSGIAEAFMDNVPMLVLACGIRSDTGTSYQLHAIDQLAMLAPITKATFGVKTADDIYPMIREAISVARRGTPGPVAVEIPMNLLLLSQKVEPLAYTEPPSTTPSPDREQIELAARMLGEAEHPAFYVGAGAAGGVEQLVELAEKLGAPVTTSIQGKGVFPESHPLWLWNGFGAQAPPFVRKIMERCDCLLAVGVRFGEVATGSYGIEPPSRLIHVDINPEVFNRNFTAELAIEADAGEALSTLNALVHGSRPRSELEQQIADGHLKVQSGWDAAPSEERVTPQRFFQTLQRLCRPASVYSTDSGNGTFLAMEHLRLDGPGRFIGPVDFSCMGYSVPGAIGAAFAGGDRDVVALAGDGAFLMTSLELLTAATYRAAPLVCVLRDGKLGQIAQFQKIPLARETCTVLPDYRVEDIARATGCRYFRILRDHELEGVLTAALELVRAGVPAVVEVAIDYSRKTYFTKGVVKTNFWRLPWSERLRMLRRALGRRLLG